MRKRSNFTKEEKIQIVKEYLSNNLSAKEMNEKYGLTSQNAIMTWRVRYLKEAENLAESEKSPTFAPIIPDTPEQADKNAMGKEKTKEELEAEIKRLERDLRWEQLKNKALNTLIDIAERDGIKIRKKSGAKQ